ncbi:NUDIX domain-containing protein [Bacillaceae bacterium SIJ1]|uniref:NUDIX domain-containing protein n=1 Tax=Litoribacterium kuwaitense TaxID=1398745 RepID=UPI0013EA4BDE|nr:NUDIX domain-containing protein [Litoribacterium kuwaitense]NGP46211.1 NUDIX domain-containing protein [Litoribacterium kuwaitense]
MHIRNSVKAIIIQEGQVLLTKNQDDEGYFYLFPGGGQEHGETFHQTLKRECIEEIGREVTIGDLVHIREYIGKHHEHAVFDHDAHQVEYYFVCSLVDEHVSPLPTHPDAHQVGVEWLSVRDLLQYRTYPKAIREHIIASGQGEAAPIYLGDVN